MRLGYCNYRIRFQAAMAGDAHFETADCPVAHSARQREVRGEGRYLLIVDLLID